MRPEPKIVNSLLDDKTLIDLQDNFKQIYKEFPYDPGFGRYSASDSQFTWFKEVFQSTVATARKEFNSETLLPTYALFAHYEGFSSLYKHKDDNACTYTLDLCVYQNQPWDLYVEDKSYLLEPNQALAYYGNDQEHWREKIPNPDSQYVGMIFFHYAEPDHWFFTKGPEYIQVIRNMMSEEEYNNNVKNGLL